MYMYVGGWDGGGCLTHIFPCIITIIINHFIYSIFFVDYGCIGMCV